MHRESMNSLLLDFKPYQNEYSLIHQESGYTSNGDGAILYSMLRELKPTTVIEVGSGYSTVVMDEALKASSELDGVERNIISIEPYPKPVLRALIKQSERVKLIENKVEFLDVSIFTQLTAGDLLFIDTSHVIDVANDVHFLYLRVLTQLPVGVIIHIHDIRFPYEYPKDWLLKAKKHWGEQYLLHMFLAYNDSFEIIFASNYLCQNDRKTMSSILHGLDNEGEGWPGSFWIKRIK